MLIRHTGCKLLLGLMCSLSLFSARSAQAGPLLDWLFGRRNTQPAVPVGPPIPLGTQVAGYAPYGASVPAVYPGVGGNYAAQYSAGTAFSGTSAVSSVGSAGFGCTGATVPGGTGTTLPAPSLPPPSVGGTYPGVGSVPSATGLAAAPYVPNFSSYAARVPVTYYRPVVTTDPSTGAQRVVMAPCSSYEYQTQRVRTFGRRSLFGSLFAPRQPQPLPQAQPVYTLPSGGIPIATVPMVPVPVTGAVGGYTTMQPVVGYGGSVATGAPVTLGTAPAAVGTVGGCNSSTPSVPGLFAPSTPSSGSALPGTSVPGTSGSPPVVLPPSSAPSSDPAASVPPSLSSTTPRRSGNSSPITGDRDSQVVERHVVQQPEASRVSDQGNSPTGSSQESDRSLPVLRPIPLPEGYEPARRWNPGLLSEDDLTAQRELSIPADTIEDSKPIHWASFEGRADEVSESQRRSAKASLEETLEMNPSSALDGNVLRPITPPRHARQETPRREAPTQLQLQQPLRSSAPKYETGGWKPSRG